MSAKASSVRSKTSKTSSTKKVAAQANASNDEISLDDRRRLENRLEELKLAREVREFDFESED
jgi:hypothetical protein